MANICRGGLNSATRFARWPSHPLSMRLQATDQCGSWACHFSMSTPCTMIVAMAKNKASRWPSPDKTKKAVANVRSVQYHSAEEEEDGTPQQRRQHEDGLGFIEPHHKAATAEKP